MLNIEEVLTENFPNLKERAMNHIKAQPNLFDDLMQAALGEKQPVGWRAAWVAAEIIKKNKDFKTIFETYIDEIIDKLEQFKSGGQKREFLKALLLFKIKEEKLGVLINLCFNWLQNPKVDAAIRVHAMQHIYNLSKKEPDLLVELNAILEDLYENENAGFQSRARKILAQKK